MTMTFTKISTVRVQTGDVGQFIWFFHFKSRLHHMALPVGINTPLVISHRQINAPLKTT